MPALRQPQRMQSSARRCGSKIQITRCPVHHRHQACRLHRRRPDPREPQSRRPPAGTRTNVGIHRGGSLSSAPQAAHRSSDGCRLLRVTVGLGAAAAHAR